MLNEITRRLKEAADVWIDIDKLSDVEAAYFIREDRIDILFDLLEILQITAWASS